MPIGSANLSTPDPSQGWPQGGRLPVGDRNVPPNLLMLLQMMQNLPPSATPSPSLDLSPAGPSTGLDTIGSPGYSK